SFQLMSVVINLVHLRLVRECPHFNDFTFSGSSLSILRCNKLICDCNLYFSMTNYLLFYKSFVFILFLCFISFLFSIHLYFCFYPLLVYTLPDLIALLVPHDCILSFLLFLPF